MIPSAFVDFANANFHVEASGPESHSNERLLRSLARIIHEGLVTAQ